MRGLDHRSRTRRRRARRRHCRSGIAGRDCRSCKKLYRKIFAAVIANAMKRTQQIVFIALLSLAAFPARADFDQQLAEAARPLNEGVPEVSVARLRELLKQNLPEAEWRATAEKLLEALVDAHQEAEAFKLLDDPRLRPSRAANFWRAQLLASSDRKTEALDLYQQIVADSGSPLRTEARFGAAEMLRALGKTEGALQLFSELSRDPKWGIRAQLREAELYLEKSDAV